MQRYGDNPELKKTESESVFKHPPTSILIKSLLPLCGKGIRPYISMILIGARLLGSEAFYNSSSGSARSPNSVPQSQQIKPSSHGIHCVEPQSGHFISIRQPSKCDRKFRISRCEEHCHRSVFQWCFLRQLRRRLQ